MGFESMKLSTSLSECQSCRELRGQLDINAGWYSATISLILEDLATIARTASGEDQVFENDNEALGWIYMQVTQMAKKLGDEAP